MAEESNLEVIGEHEQLKCKIADILDKVQPGRESANGRRVTIEEVFGKEPSMQEQYAFYEVEYTYYTQDPSLDNPLCYWNKIPKSQEEVDRVNALVDKENLSAMLILSETFASIGKQQESIGWLVSAANLGSSQACNRLGEVYLHGEGVERDPKQAVQCFEAAIKMAADSTALGHLGLCYLDGDGVERDVHKGLSLLERSARQGNSVARMLLGDLYSNGEVFAQDFEKALRWYELGCSGYDVTCYDRLVDLLLNQEDYERIIRWADLYMQMRVPRAYATYGILSVYGKGVNEDRETAMRYLLKAANMEEPSATYALFLLLRDTDKDSSLKYLEKAVALRWPSAEYDYGVMNWDVDRQKATDAIMDAVSQGYGMAHEFAVEHGLIPKE